ncbi:MAG TPA: transporter [Terriglobia bacterium]|nr:transporter [Terriglobia bacterium]
MTRYLQIGLLSLIVLSCTSPLYSQDDNTVGPDRPSFSTGAHIVPARRIQLEGGISKQRFGDTTGYDVGELLLRAGLWSRFEFRFGLPTYAETKSNDVRTSGMKDSSIGGKILLKSGDKGAVAVLATAILPTGSRRIDEHKFQPGGTLISDVNLSKKMVVTTNVGYIYSSWEAQRHDLTFAVSTLNFALTKDINIYSEFYVQNLRHTWIHRYAATGGSWTVRKRTAFDWSTGFGLYNEAHGPDYYFGFGISRLF